MQGGSCGGSLSAPLISLFRSQKPFRVADEVRNPNLFIYTKVKFSFSSNILRMSKIFFFFFGGLRPRPGKIFGFVAVRVRVAKPPHSTTQSGRLGALARIF